MNIIILDYCNVYSADMYIYIHLRICTHLDFRPIWQYLPFHAHSSHWPSSVKVSYTEDHQTVIKDVPPIHKVVLGQQHGTDRRCPEGMWPVSPKDFTISKGFLGEQPPKLWNSSTKYDNGTETISSVNSLISQNDNKTSYHSLKFGVQALGQKSHPMWLQILLPACTSPLFYID